MLALALAALLSCPAGSAAVAHCETARLESAADFAACYDFGNDVAPLFYARYDGAESPVEVGWLPAQRDVLVTGVVVNGRAWRSYAPFAAHGQLLYESYPRGIETLTWCGRAGYVTWTPGVVR